MWVVSSPTESGWIVFLVQMPGILFEVLPQTCKSLTLSRQNGSAAVSLLTARKTPVFLYHYMELADAS